MRFLCCGLMSPPPERPCDDVGRLNSFLRETLGYAADFLDRPTDEVGCLGVALDFRPGLASERCRALEGGVELKHFYFDRSEQSSSGTAKSAQLGCLSIGPD